MSKKTKLILIIVGLVMTLFLATVVVGFYTIYKYGKENNLLEEETLSKDEYLLEKEDLEQKQNEIVQQLATWQSAYLNKQVTYEEYQKQKTALELEQKKLEQKRLELEDEYHEDD